MECTLQELEQALKSTLDESDAQTRYRARQKPVIVRLNYHDSTFTVSEISLKNDELTLTIDPKF